MDDIITLTRYSTKVVRQNGTQLGLVRHSNRDLIICDDEKTIVLEPDDVITITKFVERSDNHFDVPSIRHYT